MHILRDVIMTFNLKLFALSHVCSHSGLLMPANGIPNESSTSLRPRLGEVGTIEFPFQFWDHFDKFRIKVKLDELNTAQSYVMSY